MLKDSIENRKFNQYYKKIHLKKMEFRQKKIHSELQYENKKKKI